MLAPIARKAGPSATDLIRADHARVLAAFHRYKADSSPARKKAIVGVVCTSLLAHARMEEEIFYPAMRAAGSTLLGDLESEHQEMKSAIATLSGMDARDPQYDAAFMELMRDVIHHVADEETMLLASAESVLGGEINVLGARMMKRRTELMAPRAMPGAALGVLAGVLLAGWTLRRLAR
jgi:hemerythrin superfamily protein